MDGTARPPRKRRGKCALIDPERVRHLVAEGMSRADIAELYEVSTNAVDGICSDYGISGRPKKYKTKVKAESPVDKASSRHAPNGPPVPEKTASLIATGGRYADLRVWAQRYGVTEAKARQEWHKLRLPISRGAST